RNLPTPVFSSYATHSTTIRTTIHPHSNHDIPIHKNRGHHSHRNLHGTSTITARIQHFSPSLLFRHYFRDPNNDECTSLFSPGNIFIISGTPE
ncbi:hypothetical protein COCCADRAFT_88368, partial [Bipolaris zeicola 26-R-13]